MENQMMKNAQRKAKKCRNIKNVVFMNIFFREIVNNINLIPYRLIS